MDLEWLSLQELFFKFTAQYKINHLIMARIAGQQNLVVIDLLLKRELFIEHIQSKLNYVKIYFLFLNLLDTEINIYGLFLFEPSRNMYNSPDYGILSFVTIMSHCTCTLHFKLELFVRYGKKVQSDYCIK